MRKYYKFILPAVLSVILGIVATIINVIYHSPYESFKREIEKDNAIEARRIYSANKDNEKFVTKIEKLIEKYNDEQKERYIKNEISYNEAKSNIDAYSTIYKDKASKDLISKIELSRKNYEKGVQAEKEEKYEEAIKCYKLVVEEDVDNYSNIQDKIDNCKNIIISDAITKSDSFLSKSEYLNAYRVLSNIDDEFKNDEVTSKIDAIKQQYNNNVVNGANQYISKGDTLEALIYMYNNMIPEIQDQEVNTLYEDVSHKYTDMIIEESDKLLSDKKLEDCLKYLDNSIITCNTYGIKCDNIQAKNKDVAELYAVDAITKAEKQAESGNYNTAISILELAQTKVDHPKFSSLMKEYKQRQSKELMSDYKKVIVYSYDKLENKYTIKPSGVKDANYVHPDIRNIEPVIIVTDHDVSFLLTCEYTYKSSYEYFRMDKLLIQCDDQQYVFDIGYNDSKNDTDYSYPYTYYYEWTTLIHSSYLSYNKSDTVFDMSNFAKDIINSNSVTLRFYDGGKKRDFIVPSYQQVEFKNMWNLYLLLVENPDGIDNLI